MDVSANTFRSVLPSTLGAISRAHFVSFDLELSGIPGRQTGQQRPPGQSGDGKQTLQERYQETKKAAERYQVLQLGLTCVEEDTERGLYVLRPYNFFLNPVPDKRLDVEREVTFQSGAMEFLLGVGFSMETLFSEGVQYFSREEESRARATAAFKRDKTNFADIFIKDNDADSYSFIQRVRQEVTLWKETGMPGGYLNIAPINHASTNSARGLNGFQKRLVHQLIRADFTDVVSIPKYDFIQLSPYDKNREDAMLRRKELRFEQNLTSQIGLRWVAEAMCPNVDRVLPPECTPPNAFGNLMSVSSTSYPPVMMTDDDRGAYDYRFNQLLMQLAQKNTVLVGHNVFLDLIYFYSCFFGPLPDRVEDFQQIIADLFPLVFDTKYLADKINNNSTSYNSSLEDLDRELCNLPLPVIGTIPGVLRQGRSWGPNAEDLHTEIPPEHNKYASSSPVHEAGFDSFLTAKVLIRLAAQIGTEPERDASPLSEDDVYVIASEDQNGPYIEQPTVPRKNRGQRNRNSKKTVKADQSALSHDNPYSVLEDLSFDDHQYASPPHPLASAPQLPTHTMMPPGDSNFWVRYGNKLRVNGTVEEVCVIRGGHA